MLWHYSAREHMYPHFGEKKALVKVNHCSTIAHLNNIDKFKFEIQLNEIHSFYKN